MKTSTPFKSDCVLGYKIIKRLGSGGYGEVWSAEAPGGLMKAVKILYGFHDEKKAQAELRALDKIKQLRHPFLLSLERIEVFENQLIVITEMADRCLADVYNDYVAKGASGIPREELLEYMKQAADVLDFISIEHGLQHLDVKPENLLMVGRHAKLADFGLVKSLQDVTQSLMGGLTPAYAAPELFDGRPTLQSDQYSLAIVFQEMLTGERCFDGTTPAQLASQHIHGQPNLARLSKSDQAVVSRALSKKPELRFKSCRAFVDELINRKSMTREMKRLNIPARAKADTECADIKVVGRMPTNDVTQCISSNQFRSKKIQTRFVGPPDAMFENQELTPTLIVGIGKTATRICQKLKQKIRCCTPNSNQLPAFRMLCLDSDRSDLTAATCGINQSVLDYEETFSLPLRKPEDYRQRAHAFSSWLNRRWIYNVPKSLQTEGLRPLARLAFVDNFNDLWKKLQTTLEGILSPESLALSSETLGKPVAQHKIRVFLVASISGGMGSGMSLDLAFAIKVMLRQMGYQSECISALLINGNNSRERDMGLGVANALAFLSELRHFTQNGFPGDSTCDLPPVEGELPIDYPYFLNFGDNLLPTTWNQRMDAVAEYLYLNTFTKAASFFDRCRELESEIDSFMFRSFGLANSGFTSENLNMLGQFVTETIVNRWLGNKEPHPDAFVDVSDQLHDIQLNHIRAVADKHLSMLVSDESVQQLASKVSFVAANSKVVSNELFHEIREIYGKNTKILDKLTVDGFATPTEIVEAVLNSLAPEIQKLRKQLSEALQYAGSKQRFSYKVFSKIAKEIGASLEQFRDQAISESQADTTRAAQLEKEILAALNSKGSKAGLSGEITKLVGNLAEIIKDSVVCEIASQIYRSLVRHLALEVEPVERSRIQLAGRIRDINQNVSEKLILENLEGIDRLVIEKVVSDMTKIVDAAELRYYHNAVASKKVNYREFLMDDQLNYSNLFQSIMIVARSELIAFGRTINMDQLLINNALNNKEATDGFINTMTASAAPMLDSCGGDARLMVAIPELATTAMVAQSIAQCANVPTHAQHVTCGNLIVVAEGEKISLADIAFRLAEKRSDSLDLVKRIHTRNDIQWSEMGDII